MVPLLERKFILLFKYIYCAGVKIFILPGAMLKVVDILNKHFFALYIYIYIYSFYARFMSSWKSQSWLNGLLVYCLVFTVSCWHLLQSNFSRSHSSLLQPCESIFYFNQVSPQDFVEHATSSSGTLLQKFLLNSEGILCFTRISLNYLGSGNFNLVWELISHFGESTMSSALESVKNISWFNLYSV